MKLPFPYERNKPLSDFSTFGIGGPARFFTVARTEEEIRVIIRFAFRAKLPYIVIGKGSNSLFADSGFDGLVILNRIDYMQQNDDRFVAGSGYSFARLGQQTARADRSGLEFAAGIPATVGGAIFMNAGANGQETKDTLEEVKFMTEEGDMILLSKPELVFGYRTSLFHQRGGVIIEGTFHLPLSEKVSDKQRAILRTRLQTQPYQSKSAGCAFRNPPGGLFAGRLIEECGLKGMRKGGAEVSLLHGNFIINQGGATAQDVLDLIAAVQEIVYKKKGILLEQEIRVIDFSSIHIKKE